MPAPGLWNRIRTMVGKGQTHTRSGGLILLDLPDFDSVRRDNRELVERMVGYVDVLVWVVDPQKYADAVLHHEFIEPLAAHGGTMLCVQPVRSAGCTRPSPGTGLPAAAGGSGWY